MEKRDFTSPAPAPRASFLATEPAIETTSDVESDRELQRRMARARIALFLAGFATFSLIYCTQPLLPEFAAEFHLSAAASSLALSLTTGCLAFSILCAGALSESLGRRGLMFGSMAAAAVLNFISAIAPTWETMLVARALEGLLLGGVPAVAMAYLAEEVPPKLLGAAMGLYIGGTAFGGMTGRVAIGALTQLMSWRAAMGTVALIDLAVACAFVWLLPRSRNFTIQRGLKPGSHLRAWRDHLRDTALSPLFMIGFLVMGAFVTVYNYAGFRLAAEPFLLNQTEIGLIFLVYIFGIFASYSAGSLADRFGRPTVMIGGGLVFLAGLGLTTLHTLTAIIAGIAVVTVGFFIVHSVASSAVGRTATRNRGHASSLYLLAYYVGSSVLGSVGGWAWRVDGWNAVAGYGAALIALVLLAAAMMMRAAASSAAASQVH
jgi:YNFM family putative membrane transporter